MEMKPADTQSIMRSCIHFKHFVERMHKSCAKLPVISHHSLHAHKMVDQVTVSQ